MKKRNTFIDVVKGTLILIVVMRHVFQIVALDSDVDYLCNLMAIFEMPFFILLSGYFSLPLMSNNAKFNISKKIKKISCGYLIPYFSYFVVFRLFFYCQFSDFSSLAKWIFNISESLWYLLAIWILNIFSLIAYILVKNKRNNTFKFVLFTLFYFGLNIVFLLIGIFVGIDFLGCKLVLYYSGFYFLGYLLHNYENYFFRIYNKFGQIIVFISVSVYFILGYKFKVMAAPDYALNICIRFILAICGIITFTYIVQILYKNIKCTILRKIGLFTLEIYYVHSFLLNSIEINKSLHLMTITGLKNTLIMSVYIGLFCFLIINIVKNNCEYPSDDPIQ